MKILAAIIYSFKREKSQPASKDRIPLLFIFSLAYGIFIFFSLLDVFCIVTGRNSINIGANLPLQLFVFFCYYQIVVYNSLFNKLIQKTILTIKSFDDKVGASKDFKNLLNQEKEKDPDNV